MAAVTETIFHVRDPDDQRHWSEMPCPVCGAPQAGQSLYMGPDIQHVTCENGHAFTLMSKVMAGHKVVNDTFPDGPPAKPQKRPVKPEWVVPEGEAIVNFCAACGADLCDVSLAGVLPPAFVVDGQGNVIGQVSQAGLLLVYPLKCPHCETPMFYKSPQNVQVARPSTMPHRLARGHPLS